MAKESKPGDYGYNPYVTPENRKNQKKNIFEKIVAWLTKEGLRKEKFRKANESGIANRSRKK